MTLIKTSDYLASATEIIDKVKPLAAKYHKLTGRPLGVTGEVAEYEIVKLLNLECCVARQSGYDALRKKGKDGKKFRLKEGYYKTIPRQAKDLDQSS